MCPTPLALGRLLWRRFSVSACLHSRTCRRLMADREPSAASIRRLWRRMADGRANGFAVSFFSSTPKGHAVPDMRTLVPDGPSAMPMCDSKSALSMLARSRSLSPRSPRSLSCQVLERARLLRGLGLGSAGHAGRWSHARQPDHAAQAFRDVESVMRWTRLGGIVGRFCV